jgi:hypothetical protein
MLLLQGANGDYLGRWIPSGYGSTTVDELDALLPQPAGSRNTGVRSRVAPVAAIRVVRLGVVEQGLALGAPPGRAVSGVEIPTLLNG